MCVERGRARSRPGQSKRAARQQHKREEREEVSGVVLFFHPQRALIYFFVLRLVGAVRAPRPFFVWRRLAPRVCFTQFGGWLLYRRLPNYTNISAPFFARNAPLRFTARSLPPASFLCVFCHCAFVRACALLLGRRQKNALSSMSCDAHVFCLERRRLAQGGAHLCMGICVLRARHFPAHHQSSAVTGCSLLLPPPAPDRITRFAFNRQK